MSHPIVFTPLQARFLTIPQAPLCYWLRERFFELLAGRTLGDVADVPEGLGTRDDAHFVRFTWEICPDQWARPVRERRWVPFEKGGGYGKWFGHHWWVVDWEHGGARIKAFPSSVVRNEQYYFREGWTYSHIARGSLGFRKLLGTDIFSDKSAGVITDKNSLGLSSMLNCRLASFIGRSTAQSIDIRESYVARIPLPERIPDVLAHYEAACVALKRWLVARDPTERTFGPSPPAPLPPCGRGEASGARRGEGPPVAPGRILRGDSSTAIRELARSLRRAGNRPEEVLWEALRDRRFLGLKFRRQHPLGPFIADFYCADHLLAVEIDGGAHSPPQARDRDVARDEWLTQRGIRVVRIPADIVLEAPEEALAAIADAVREPSPRPIGHPSPARGRGDGGEGPPEGEGLRASWRLATDEAETVAAVLHTLEGLSEREVFGAYGIAGEDLQAVLDETGTPAGWYPLVAGYDALPPLPAGLSVDPEVLEPLAREPRHALSPEELADLKRRLCVLYEAGPGARGEDAPSPPAPRPLGGRGEASGASRGEGEPEGEGDDEEEEAAVSGARIPIPAETFLEELAQKLEIHPISVYWLLKELREREGGVCRPELRRFVEDYFSVLILRLLGHRWPAEALTPGSPLPLRGRGAGGEGSTALPPGGRGAGGEGSAPLQEAGERPGVRAAEDGIIPLSDGTGQPTLLDRVRERIAADFGAALVDAIEQEFRQIMGRSLADWLARDFFPAHVSRFKKRPIAWLLESGHALDPRWEVTSPRRKGQRAGRNGGPAFACLVSYHRLTADTLTRVKTHVLRPVLQRREFELAETRRQVAEGNVTARAAAERLAESVDELKAFEATLDRVSERGFWSPRLEALLAREQPDAWARRTPKSPVPDRESFLRQEQAYDPDLNDGVRVNIAPLQKYGLLAADVLAPKDVDKAIADRAEWRADERRWCREGKLPKPGWWEYDNAPERV